jgi:pantetheine-phosphate adenylyltransferase
MRVLRRTERLGYTPGMPKGPTHAVYPGSFDPVTMGHLDIIRRCLKIFDRVTVAILTNPQKKPLFSLPERMALLRHSTRWPSNGRLRVEAFEGLLVDFARRRRATAIVRGLREISDFEYEFQMALMNRRLDPSIETVFMMPKEEYSYLSSRLVKEIASLGGKVQGLVSPPAAAALKKAFGGKKRTKLG